MTEENPSFQDTSKIDGTFFEGQDPKIAFVEIAAKKGSEDSSVLVIGDQNSSAVAGYFRERGLQVTVIGCDAFLSYTGIASLKEIAGRGFSGAWVGSAFQGFSAEILKNAMRDVLSVLENGACVYASFPFRRENASRSNQGPQHFDETTAESFFSSLRNATIYGTCHFDASSKASGLLSRRFGVFIQKIDPRRHAVIALLNYASDIAKIKNKPVLTYQSYDWSQLLSKVDESLPGVWKWKPA